MELAEGQIGVFSQDLYNDRQQRVFKNGEKIEVVEVKDDRVYYYRQHLGSYGEAKREAFDEYVKVGLGGYGYLKREIFEEYVKQDELEH